jgi:hypothetical protein
VTRDELMAEAANAASAVLEYLRDRHGKTMCVCVWLAEADTDETAYAANVSGAQLSRALRELADRLDSGLVSDPPGPRAQG